MNLSQVKNTIYFLRELESLSKRTGFWLSGEIVIKDTQSSVDSPYMCYSCNPLERYVDAGGNAHEWYSDLNVNMEQNVNNMKDRNDYGSIISGHDSLIAWEKHLNDSKNS